MPGIDSESISALKETKTGKEVFFALVVKNANVGSLLVNKSGKVPAKKIEEAQKDCGVKTLVIGRCSATNGTLTVQSVKGIGTNGETLTKHLAKDAGFTHCEFVTNAEAESDKPSRPTTPAPKLPPKFSTQSSETSSSETTSSEETSSDTTEQKNGLKHRLETILEWCKANKDGLGTKDTVERTIPVARQANDALKQGDLVEAEKKLVLIEKYLKLDSSQGTQQTRPRSITPPPIKNVKQDYNRAKQGLDVFKQTPEAGWNTNEGKESIKSIRSDLLNLISGERSVEDDISRKGILFDSKDTSYKKNVTDVVTKTMLAIEKVMSDPTKDTGGEIKKVNDAVDLLAIQRAHYADTRGITDSKMLDQRKRKVEAIDKHIGEMRKINGKLRDVLKLKMKPAHDMLNSLAALSKDSPEDAKEAIKEFTKALSENEQMRQELFQSVGPDQSGAIHTFLEALPQSENDKWCRELALTRAGDPGFMDVMCNTAIVAEAKKQNQGTFFRINSTATKLATNYAQNSPGGKVYCQNANARYSELAKGKGSMELDKLKNKDLTEKDIQKNVQGQTAMLGSVVDDMSQDPGSVPPEIAKICKTFYDEAKRVSGGDEEFATTQSGGFLMLRVVNPGLINATTNEVNEINNGYLEVKKQAKEKWVKSGKDVKDFQPPEMPSKDRERLAKAQEKQRLVVLQTKALQNIANGVEFGEKEAYMIPMNSVVKKDGKFSPTATKLRDFLKNVAQRG